MNDIPKYRVHLLQCLALCFWHKEIHEENAQKEAASEQEVQAPARLVSVVTSSWTVLLTSR